jgi:hypothetical protein
LNPSGTYLARLGVENDTDRPRIVWVEPWGEDYTLLPKERLEIVVQSTLETPWFNVIEHADSTQVYIEGQSNEGQPNDYDALQMGKKILCGHRRQAALDAGLRF